MFSYQPPYTLLHTQTHISSSLSGSLPTQIDDKHIIFLPSTGLFSRNRPRGISWHIQRPHKRGGTLLGKISCEGQDSGDAERHPTMCYLTKHIRGSSVGYLKDGWSEVEEGWCTGIPLTVRYTGESGQLFSLDISTLSLRHPWQWLLLSTSAPPLLMSLQLH
uniref:Uncharacterized protein n=1 Tax=Trypanosoma vivax (strain Y486) TaxID=1055687 RepID=G0U1L3_TRYVY|nr:hypothetical protein, unlikely [Trypanosoma vivax Y486]